MPLKWNVGLQILGTLLAAGTVVSGYLPPKYAALAVGVIGGLKTIQSAVAQHYNTNGTNQTEPGGSAAPSVTPAH